MTEHVSNTNMTRLKFEPVRARVGITQLYLKQSYDCGIKDKLYFQIRSGIRRKVSTAQKNIGVSKTPLYSWLNKQSSNKLKMPSICEVMWVCLRIKILTQDEHNSRSNTVCT